MDKPSSVVEAVYCFNDPSLLEYPTECVPIASCDTMSLLR
jgi:hypothetical protein